MRLSAYRALELFFDGPIPDDMKREALRLDAAATPSRRLRPKPPARTPAWLVKRMSEVIRATAIRRSGRCEREDLLKAGFSPREIARHQEEAIAKAAQDAATAGEFRGSPDIPVALILIARRLKKSA